jgi:hypothetical protein
MLGAAAADFMQATASWQVAGCHQGFYNCQQALHQVL